MSHSENDFIEDTQEIDSQDGEYEEESIEILVQRLQIAEDNLQKASHFGVGLLKQIETLKEEKKELEFKFNESTITIQDLEHDIRDLEKDNLKLRKELENSKERTQDLEHDINKMNREFDFLKQFEISNQKLKKEVEDLKSNIQDWNRKSERWAEEKKQNEQIIEEQKSNINNMKNKLNDIQEGKSKEVISVKQYESLQKDYLEVSFELRKLKSEHDMEKMKFFQDKTVFLSEQKELINKLEDQEKVASVKKELRNVRRAISTLRETSKNTKEECAETLENMRNEISSISMSLSSFINNVPLNEKETVKYRIVDEIGYAQIQAKVIKELGLDSMYASFGKEKILPQKVGFIDVCVQEKKNLFGRNQIFNTRWIVFSSISVSIYMDENAAILERRESLEGVKVGLGPSNDFFLYFPSKAKIVFRGNSAVHRDEWFTFVERLAIQLSYQYSSASTKQIKAE